MRRLPLIPTLVVAAAAALMAWLGVWQLHRAAWKKGLLAQYEANAALPALDLDPLLARGAAHVPLAFRRVLVTCHAHDVVPDSRGGRSLGGEPGTIYLVPCRPGAGGLAGRLMVDVGWTGLPLHGRRLSLDGLVAGRLGSDDPGYPIRLTSAAATPPLQPAAAPSIADVPNNHISYAIQWFFFAGLAILIYALALRRRERRLPPDA
jgi:cytochrome oxidase assembly protein ShyY1